MSVPMGPIPTPILRAMLRLAEALDSIGVMPEDETEEQHREASEQ